MLEIDTEFEQEAAAERLLLPSRVRTDRTWLMAERLAAVLRRQGFIARVHFLARARAFGVRLDPATFRRQFLQARHYRQTRPGYRNRIAVIAGMPVLYRMGGPRGRHVVLLGVLPRMPPVARAAVPLLAPAREAEAVLRFDSPEIRTVCEQARAYAHSVPTAFRPPLHPGRYRLRRDALRTPLRRPASNAASKRARDLFDLRLQPTYARRLGVGRGGQVHHAIELQALDRYPGVFTENELNAFNNMRGIPAENKGLRQLHNSKVREIWNRTYRELDQAIIDRQLTPGTPQYNRFVRSYIESARDYIDWYLGQFFSEYRTGRQRSFL